MRTRRPLIPILVLALILGACSKDEPASGLPDGTQLLTESADAMDGASTVGFILKVEGDRPSNFQITDAEGTITREGAVSANAKVLQAGTLVEYEYIVAGDVPYLKGPTGGFRQVPQAIYSRIFDPTGLLGGERSLPNALREVRNAITEDTEEIDGIDTYRITGELDPTQVEGLSLLASGAAGESTLWINTDTKELVRARVPFTIPGEDGETVVTVSLSDYNAPADIQAPV
ncbi:N/A [soil metagenome]